MAKAIQNFELLNTEDKLVSLNDSLGQGKPIFIYIYPTDEKFKCNRSECPFKENLEKIQKEGVIVIGISQDTVEEHREFKHKYNINFELLSDPTLGTVKGLGAYEKVFVNGIEKEKVIRKGILVDDKGHIIKEWEPLKIEEETEDVIKVIRSLKSH
ncbi:MAG TPA: peroxiredoxin [Sulfurihydrogenibium sp.]|uniref:peroxiredoxin n=1 Tax=Sulfurihydrogenibium sp. (strain YO3AOP1) TaxID=436114 RepID=UPI000172375D|nr:redoxin domain-containing protein [Sulfurihydrogenibium sp. YO3AOP1]ACD65688.1 alkyl hydroperoxide reductase/ Thiol specific antioxidant/ Mal allergen [Sulfurihydrogenibium sp. YO3AOP1]HBT98454.1 peroxiredoxin [Sulfurihydrogenibium sp.]